MHWQKNLDRLRFQPKDGPVARESLEEIEGLIGVKLPDEYRRFLLEVGGGYLPDALVPSTMPTPFGDHNLTVLHSAVDVIELLYSSVTPRNMICIGYGHFGKTTCLSVAGLDHGQVFSLDTEMKFYWNQETLDSLPHLAQSVREFFRLRDAALLPERPWGYENCYHLANSFSEFLDRCYICEPEASSA